MYVTSRFGLGNYNWFIHSIEKNGVKLAKNRFLRTTVLSMAEKVFQRNYHKRKQTEKTTPPGVIDDSFYMSLAILNSLRRGFNDYQLSDSTLDKVINIVVKDVFLEQKARMQKSIEFKQKYGYTTPSFLVISPTKACNLRCTGCYADADEQMSALEWDLPDKIITDAYDFWGTQFLSSAAGNHWLIVLREKECWTRRRSIRTSSS